MTDSNNDNRKKRGRPATGTAPLVGVRMTPDFQKAIKAWAKKQPDDPNLAEAIRRLVQIALAGSGRVRRRAAPKGAPTAKEMAGKEIDTLGDPAATDDERARRKRRLLKGPSEFRDMRNDHPKRKR